jgi:hypothetical protein
MALGLGSLALSIPLAAIVSANAKGSGSLFMVFALIAAVNIGYAPACGHRAYPSPSPARRGQLRRKRAIHAH